MTIEYSDINKKSFRILRHIYCKKSVTYGQLKQKYPDEDMAKVFQVLRDTDYIWGGFENTPAARKRSGIVPPDDCEIHCTPQGERYVEVRTVDSSRELREWISMVLSVLAIIISVISLLLQSCSG